MAQSKKYVVLADIESVRVPFGAFAAALDEVAKLGEIAGCKFYGYSAHSFKKMHTMHYQLYHVREKVN